LVIRFRGHAHELRFRPRLFLENGRQFGPFGAKLGTLFFQIGAVGEEKINARDDPIIVCPEKERVDVFVGRRL